jgi:8-oxo-dGTP diphosphatase
MYAALGPLACARLVRRRYPVVGVGALIFDAGRVLLVERGREPLKGYWSLPGGKVETGERLRDAVCREVLEETGLAVEAGHLLEIFERITPDYHYVLMDYMCQPIGGTLCAGDDASQAGWFTEAEIDSLKITEGTPAVIARGFAWLRENGTKRLR